MPQNTDLPFLVAEIQSRYHALQQQGALLVAVSGIDGSGKGFVSKQLEQMLQEGGLAVANIGIDPWQNLPDVRLCDTNSGPHFYHNAMRFEALFDTLVLPLKQNRSVTVSMDYMEQTADVFRPHNYHYSDIDIVLLEGIFLLQPRWLAQFDLSIWVNCSEATALRRAIARNQEGLSEAELVAEYHKIYFPAQHFHNQLDKPQELADFILDNDAEVPGS